MMESPIINDDPIFKIMYYFDSKWSMSDEGLASRKKGDSIKAIWGDYCFEAPLPLGDKIMFHGSNIASKAKTIRSLKKFAPNNIVNPIVIDGRDDEYALLQPKNHGIDDSGLEHVFMMFSKYKRLLVTQAFKDEWESRGLTGAEFTFVTEMDNSRFIDIHILSS